VSTTVLLAVLLGAMLHASWNALVHGSSEKLLDTVAILWGAALLSLLVLPWHGLPALASLPWLLASTVVHMLYFSLIILAYRGGELSVVYPLMRGAAPAMSAVGVLIFLHESPPPLGWLGVALVSGGVVLLAALAWSRGATNPRSLLMALANAAVIASYTVIDAKGARLSGNAIAYNSCTFLLNAPAMTLVALHLRGGKALVAHGRKNWLRALVGGACTMTSYGLALWAMTQAPVALVASLRETSVIFALLLGAWLAHEKVGAGKIVCVLIVASGAVIMKMA
jgi:drug/metabolite transporter (DMT)-like permease